MISYYYMFLDGAKHLKRTNLKMFICMTISLVLPIISLLILKFHHNTYFGIDLFLWCSLVAFNIVSNYVFRIDWYSKITSKSIKTIVLLVIAIIFVLLMQNVFLEGAKILNLK